MLIEAEPKNNERHRAAFNTVVNHTLEVAPVFKGSMVGIVENPKFPGTGLVLTDLRMPGKAQILSVVIGAIDPEGNPYSAFGRLEITHESSIKRTQEEEKKKPFTGFIRFSKSAQQVTDQIPGGYNVFRSPFAEDNRLIYRISGAQFHLIEHLLKGEGVDYEIVTWPKDVPLPLVPPIKRG